MFTCEVCYVILAMPFPSLLMSPHGLVYALFECMCSSTRMRCNRFLVQLGIVKGRQC